ncbi:MAG TPA: potassium channel family protein [Mycobacteriales bacterium]|jgi:voltage-gated potassium channel
MAVRPGSRSDAESVRLPARPIGPVVAISRRLLAALAILLAVVAVVLIDRDGYRDVTGNRIGVIDAFYYTTVTLSTTGYGDITPVSSGARLVNVLFVTPARVLFLIILVGTTLEVLTERSREQFRIRRWRSRVREHVVVCGYGTKGRSAVAALLEDGTPLDRIVVVELNGNAAKEATARGLVVVHGSSSRSEVLRQAEIGTAKAVVVATDTDDATVLSVLTARDLAPDAWIVAAVRETENIPLVRQSGADQVVVSSATAGRLLGLSTSAPQLVTVIEDLLTASTGIALTVRPVRAEEVGRAPGELGQPVAAVVRGGELRNYADPSVQRLDHGDRLVCISDVDRGMDPGSGPRAAVPGEDR